MDTKELEHFLIEYGKDIYSFCVYLTGSRQEADDLYQQTFLVAMEKNEMDREKNLKSYLITIAVNIRNNQKRKFLWRKKKADVVRVEEETWGQIPSLEETIESQLLQKEMQEVVRKHVQELPDKMKIVILMFYMEDMSIEEISKALQIPAGTVKSRLHQGKAKLKERLVQYEL